MHPEREEFFKSAHNIIGIRKSGFTIVSCTASFMSGLIVLDLIWSSRGYESYVEFPGAIVSHINPVVLLKPRRDVAAVIYP